jgi:hypothetical protein
VSVNKILDAFLKLKCSETHILIKQSAEQSHTYAGCVVEVAHFSLKKLV